MNKQEFIQELEDYVKIGILSKQNFYYDRDYHELYIIDIASYSDYTGTCVEKANNIYFKKEYSFISEQYGGYGTVWTTIESIDNVDGEELENFLNDLNSLTEYPVISDDLMFEYENKAEQEAWDTWTRDDFIDLTEKKFEYDLEEYNCIDLEEYFEKHDDSDRTFDDFVLEIFTNAKEQANEYWIIELGISAWIDLEKIVEQITWNDIEKNIK